MTASTSVIIQWRPLLRQNHLLKPCWVLFTVQHRFPGCQSPKYFSQSQYSMQQAQTMAAMVSSQAKAEQRTEMFFDWKKIEWCNSAHLLMTKLIGCNQSVCVCVCVCVCARMCINVCVCVCVCVRTCKRTHVIWCVRVLPCFVWKCLLIFVCFVCLFIYHWFV